MNLEKEFPRLTIFFQPIISTSTKELFGVEALLRGFDEENKIVSAPTLFELCITQARLEYLSNKAIELALKGFQMLKEIYPNVLLFLNIEPSLIDNKWESFKEILLDTQIENSSIVLEIKEESIDNHENLAQFCQFFKEKGFFIALDDFGSGCSNFERINSIKPDVIKLDRSLVHNFHKDVVHQEIVKAISNMAYSLGSAVLAEGVETVEDVVDARLRGITLFQGFLFDKPMATIEKKSYKSFIDDIEQLVSSDRVTLMKQRKQQFEHAKNIAHTICHTLENLLDDTDIITYIAPLLEKHQELEAFYILDVEGKQIGETAIRTDINPFYLPAPNHYDHSSKEYFVVAKESQNGEYLSRRYISQASGNLCKTYVHRFINSDETKYVCIDFKTDIKEI